MVLDDRTQNLKKYRMFYTIINIWRTNKINWLISEARCRFSQNEMMKRGRPPKKALKPRHNTKRTRKAAETQQKGKPYGQSIKREDRLCLGRREELGLMTVTEEQIRTYLSVAYAMGFNEPSADNWPEIAKELSAEVGYTTKSIITIFKKLENAYSVDVGIQRQGGTGPKRKLGNKNPGLAAASLALNANVGRVLATEVCNSVNKRILGDTAPTISHQTLINTLKEYTEVQKAAVLRRRSGSRNSMSNWAVARVARAQCTLACMQLGKLVEEDVVGMEYCASADLHPIYMNGIIFTDQSHMRAVPAGGNGHDGSMSRHQWRVRVNPANGMPDCNGVIPRRRTQIKPKFDNMSQGCYSIALKDDNPLFLKTFNYTGKKMVLRQVFFTAMRTELQQVRKAQDGGWKLFQSENPYIERYGENIEEYLNDKFILHKSNNPFELAEVMEHNWYKEMRRRIDQVSVCDFVIHLIKEGTELYRSTTRAETFVIWHDRLSILWDKGTQEWLQMLKCPIDGWNDRTWSDRFVKIRGEFNRTVSNYYKNTLPGDSPELMPLDCHLFSDIKAGVAKNVALSFFLNDNDPLKYLLRTPRLV